MEETVGEDRVGYLGNLTKGQEKDLATVKAKLMDMNKMDLVEIHGGNLFLLAFLRAEMSKSKAKMGTFNVEKSMKRIVSFLDWCTEFGFNVERSKIPVPEKYEEYKDSNPALVYMDPKAKTAIIVERFGLTYSTVDTKRLTPREWEECIGYDGLYKRSLLWEATKKFGREPTGIHAIIDEKGLGWGFATRLKFVKFVNSIVGERFPESIDKIYIINAPKVFAALFAMVKPALHKDLVEKITVTSGIPHELLRTNLDPSLLPQEFGGDNTEVTVPVTIGK